jgi:hypothetical protein
MSSFPIGTAMLLEACVESNVGIFVSCSTQDTALTTADQVDIDETVCVEPHNLGFGDYARTKLEAENLVLRKHGVLLKNGTELSLQKEIGSLHFIPPISTLFQISLLHPTSLYFIPARSTLLQVASLHSSSLHFIPSPSTSSQLVPLHPSLLHFIPDLSTSSQHFPLHPSSFHFIPGLSTSSQLSARFLPWCIFRG